MLVDRGLFRDQKNPAKKQKLDNPKYADTDQVCAINNGCIGQVAPLMLVYQMVGIRRADD
jgi:hypothetical protein